MDFNKCEKFIIVQVERRSLKNAPYNPRKIKEENRRKLKQNFEKVGSLEPIVWNKTTGNIVSGHQRIKIMDQINGTVDYMLTVAQVELDEQTEREQNIFMNNPLTQGEYDLQALSGMYSENLVKYENTGATKGDFYKLIGADIGSLEAETLIQMSEDYKNNTDTKEKMRKNIHNKNESDFYVVFVFNNTKERNETLQIMGLDIDIYQKGERLKEIIGVNNATCDNSRS